MLRERKAKFKILKWSVSLSTCSHTKIFLFCLDTGRFTNAKLYFIVNAEAIPNVLFIGKIHLIEQLIVQIIFHAPIVCLKRFKLFKILQVIQNSLATLRGFYIEKLFSLTSFSLWEFFNSSQILVTISFKFFVVI